MDFGDASDNAADGESVTAADGPDLVTGQGHIGSDAVGRVGRDAGRSHRQRVAGVGRVDGDRGAAVD